MARTGREDQPGGGDPDERDRAELARLLETRARRRAAELADRFAGRLEFGTAGLRGAIGAGPNRMNGAMVRATPAALAKWLKAREPGLPADQPRR